MSAATQRERIRQYLYRCPFGATRNVIARDTGLMVQTLCRRLRELEDLGHITGLQRVICPETGVLNKNYRLTRQPAGSHDTESGEGGMSDLQMARVFIEQARARRGKPFQRNFRATLLNWAAERRRNHIAGGKKVVGQLDLFGGAA